MMKTIKVSMVLVYKSLISDGKGAALLLKAVLFILIGLDNQKHTLVIIYKI